jgi:hypothetical protein
MRALVTIAVIIAPATAFASAGRTDNSGMFVWGFLGFCALIIVAQALPAILMLVGVTKGLRTHTEATANVKS